MIYNVYFLCLCLCLVSRAFAARSHAEHLMSPCTLPSAPSPSLEAQEHAGNEWPQTTPASLNEADTTTAHSSSNTQPVVRGFIWLLPPFYIACKAPNTLPTYEEATHTNAYPLHLQIGTVPTAHSPLPRKSPWRNLGKKTKHFFAVCVVSLFD